jgi:ABC-type multidrug transport system fused ATPase/permease subunit
MLSLKSKKKGKRKMNFFTKLWKLLEPFHKGFFVIAFMSALFEIARMGGPFIFAMILDLLIKTKGLISVQTGLYIIAGLVGVRLFSLVIDYLTDIAIFRLLFRVENYISTKAFAKMMDLSIDYHEKENTGAKINIVNKGTDKLIQLLASFSWEFQSIILMLLVSIVMMFLTNWPMGLVFTLSLVPFLLITFKTYQSTRKLRAKRHDAYEISSGELGDTITNITVVKAFAQEEREKSAFSSIWSLIHGIQKNEIKRHMLAGLGRSLLTETFYITMIFVGIFEIRNGHLSVGLLVFAINILDRAYSNIYRLGRIYERAVDASEPVDRLTNLFQQRSTVVNSPNAIVPDRVEGVITFDKVSFSYSNKLVLENVSFTIPAGSFTALVGKSGSGKSTIAKLLSRYYDPTEGSIVIDEKYPLKELDLDTYRRETAVVFQDSPVPNRKIWEIISYAAGKKTFNQVKDQVEKASRLAHAYEFIKDFPKGYQTQVGERGVKLSGGQKQRLAIARALFAEPKILIMDEPTSHLDTLSEAQIQQALEDISKKRSLTKIVIAHRLSTVQHADQILVMEKGRLVEKGTHKELLKLNGVYAKIVAQSELKG